MACEGVALLAVTIRLLRLETGKHGFAEIARFGPYVDSATSIRVQRVLTAAQ